MQEQIEIEDIADISVSPPRQPKDSARWRIIFILVAAGGGVFGVVGAVIQEFQHASLLAVFIAAPMIEEIMKPAGVYFLLARWPEALISRLFTALLAAIGGLTFAVVENVIYLELYFPEHGQDLLVYRYTVCLALHMVCSFIAGFGINQRLLASVRGEIPFLKGNKRYFIIPMVIHSLYNGASVFTEMGAPLAE